MADRATKEAQKALGDIRKRGRDERAARALRLHAEGLGSTEIAERLRVSPSGVQEMLRRARRAVGGAK